MRPIFMRLMFWRRPTVPVLELHGLIATRPGTLSAASVGPLIERAVAAAARVGTLVLDIESPGGSPVQSDLIATRIRRRAEEKGVRVVAVIGEVGASGGYWLACAADEILANAMSVVGSIGVIGGGFGLQGLIGRFGVERRLYTAGENKARLDPFSPERPQDVAFVRALLDDLHAALQGLGAHAAGRSVARRGGCDLRRRLDAGRAGAGTGAGGPARRP